MRRSHIVGSAQGATGPRVLIACSLGVEAGTSPEKQAAHLYPPSGGTVVPTPFLDST